MKIDIVSPLLQTALEVVIEVLLPIVLTALVVWINSQIKSVKTRMSTEQLTFTYSLIERLVRAAEQNGLTGAIKNFGAAKKEYVLALAKAELERHNIVVDVDTLSAMIEAEVHDAFGKIETIQPAPQLSQG